MKSLARPINWFIAAAVSLVMAGCATVERQAAPAAPDRPQTSKNSASQAQSQPVPQSSHQDEAIKTKPAETAPGPMVEPVSGPAPSGIGLRLYNKYQIVIWHNPRITDQAQLKREGALLIGASVYKMQFAVLIDGFWQKGGSANVYDATSRVSGHQLTGDFAKLSDEKQKQIINILLSQQILAPVGTQRK